MGVIEYMILIASGVTLIAAGVMLTLRRRIEHHPLSESGSRKLLYGLLLTILLLTALLLYILPLMAASSNFIAGSSGLIMAGTTPIIMSCAAVAVLHIYQTAALRNRRTALVVALFTVGFVLLSIYHVQFMSRYGSIELVYLVTGILASGPIIALIWQTVKGQNRWLWLGLCILIVAVTINNYTYNEVMETWPGVLLWLLDITASYLLPIVLITLAGRTAAYLAESPRRIDWRKWAAGGIAGGLLVVLMIVDIVKRFLLDGFDDWGPPVLPLFFSALVLAVALMLIWTLKRFRIRAAIIYVLVMLALTFTLFFVVNTINTDPKIDMVTRAGLIDQSIQAYYADNGHYPASLYDLTPRYMLAIPNPVLFSDRQNWCYEGGGEFYRLGYVSRPAWGAPPNTFSIQIQDSAGTPPAESWMCDSLLTEYRARYTDIGILRQG